MSDNNEGSGESGDEENGENDSGNYGECHDEDLMP